MRTLVLIFVIIYVFSCSSRIAASPGKGKHENETSIKQTANLARGGGGGGGVGGGSSKSPAGQSGNGGGSDSSHPGGGRVLPLYAAGAVNNQRQHSHHSAGDNPRSHVGLRSIVEAMLIVVCTIISFTFIVV